MRYRSRMPDAAVSATEVDRRTAILACTCRVIARDGADGVRMAAVAREAGVSSALLHYYFATRDELIRQAFEHHDATETQRSHEQLRRIDDPIARIRFVLANELGEDEAVQQGWFLWGEMERQARFHADYRASVVDRTNRWISLVTELIADAQEAGRVNPDLDAPAVGFRLTCLVDAFASHIALGTMSREGALRQLDAGLRDALQLGTRWAT